MEPETSQQTSQAKILIGTRRYCRVNQNVFALYINGEMVNSKKCVSGETNSYIEHCIDTAKKYGRKMMGEGIRTYNLINGQRSRFTTRELDDCNPIPQDGEDIFRQTLDSFLADN